MINSEGSLHENTVLALSILQIIFVILGTPWNITILVSVIKDRLFKEASYILLVNLVIADLLVCLVILPFNIASGISGEFTLGRSDYTRCQACQTIIVVEIALVMVSLFIFALMAVDRLIYFKQPFQYSEIVTVKKVLVILVVFWIFSVIVSTFPTFGLGEIKFANVLSSCALFVVGETSLTANSNYFLVLCFVGLFPFLTIVISNIWVLVIIYKSVHRKQKMEVYQRSRNATFHKQQIRLAQIFGALFAVTFFVSVPSIGLAVVGLIVGTDNIPGITFAYIYMTFVSQPVVHPILETCLLGKSNMLKKCFRSNKNNSSSTSHS